MALIWVGATAVVSAIVGVLSYQAGWAAGLAARLPAEAAPPYYYAPHFFGFGFFGLLPFLFLLFVLLLVFRGGRRWGPGGPGYGRFAGTTPPAPGDPWHGWPQRSPGEQAPSGQAPSGPQQG
ncbi:MAG TPA: hypothetical protein VGO86_07185 [Candidatus Dormibacteraeota bacterium]